MTQSQNDQYDISNDDHKPKDKNDQDDIGDDDRKPKAKDTIMDKETMDVKDK
jgi:hypothetical protein